MIDFSSSSNVSETVWIGASVQAFLIAGYFHVITPALLGNASLVIRWHDGVSAKSHTETLVLAALGNFKPFSFPVWLSESDDLTYEVAVSNGGTYGVKLGRCSIN